VIRQVIDLLSKGLPVPQDRWQALEAAHVDALIYTAGLRPGRMINDGAASPHVLAYHDLSRLTELLLLWRLDNIAYPENFLSGPTNRPHAAALGRWLMDMMSGDPLERAADWTVAFEQAAEGTIAAAAAALLWCGEDGQGILAHVAGSTPTKMTSSRIAAAYTKRAFPEYAEMPIDEDIANCSENLDLAALPATVAPQWAARVREAMSDTQRRPCGAKWYGESP
jgi:hypothetical protein